MRGIRDEGQAAVEVALVLPLIVLLLLAVVQVTLVARDQILVVHAARAAAREAAVGSPPARVRQVAVASAGGGLQSGRLTVDTHDGDTVTVRVEYRAPTEVPLVGALLPDVAVRANAAMRQETPPEG